VPLYAAGYPVVAMYPVAPLTVGHAMAVSCTSYNGGVFFGITADREAVPDVEEFAVHITEAVDEIRSTRPAADPGAKPARTRRSRSSS
jgi:diacylglycerol O-acyltransferase